MMKPRTFHWSNAAVLGLLFCDVALCVSGTFTALRQHELTPDQVGAAKFVCVLAFAGVAGFSLAVTQAAASVGQYLHGRGKGFAEAMAWSCAVACALVSVFGMQLAGALLNGEETFKLDAVALAAAGFFMTFVKPAMGVALSAARDVSDELAAAAKERADAADRASSERSAQADRDANTERARIAAEASARAAAESAPAGNVANLADARAKKKPRPANGRRAAAAAAGAIVAVTGAGATQAAAEPAAIVRPAVEAKPVGYTPSMEEIEQAREALHRRGVNPAFKSVAAHIGCSRQAVAKVWPKGAPLAFPA